MEGHSGNPITVKVEEHSQSIVLTYFQGDIGSMVDAHFTRALSNKSCKAKAAAAAAAAAPSGRSKKSRKTVKTEHATSCQWSIAPSTSYSEAQFQSAPGSHQLGGPNKEPHSVLPLGPADNLPGPWPSFPTRHPGLSPMPYSLSPEGFGLSGVGQQYANSLLNLLHSDRGEVGQSMGSGSKTDLLPSWTTAPPGYRDPVDPAVGFETGRDKKDLYWY